MKTFHRLVIFFLLLVKSSISQITNEEWYDYFLKTGTACKPNTCGKDDKVCECYLTIDYDLSMMLKRPGSTATLLKPDNGTVVDYNTGQPCDEKTEDSVILADGYRSKLVITVNGRFPGPAITAFEYQDIIVHVRNFMRTESTAIHWHGIRQTNTAWYDGVAFVTQCPIPPGKNFTYKFKAKPFGTNFYHAQIGNQRTMGLYGPLIVQPLNRQKISEPQIGSNVFVLTIQDWNHDDDASLSYQKMLRGVYDLNTGQLYNETSDVSGARYGRFKIHSGLINGRGRYYSSSTTNNGSPLTKFTVEKSKIYRFRVISAATMYPFRVFVQKHPVEIVASDGFEINPTTFESFVIHPGERIDFLLETYQPEDTYLLVAETLEVESENRNEYHAAEAIIYYQSTEKQINLNPPKAQDWFCSSICKVFNCPFEYFPFEQNRMCFTFNNVSSQDPNSHPENIDGDAVEYFFNFGFPGENRINKASINGRTFVYPNIDDYANRKVMDKSCEACTNESTICDCTYSVTINGTYENKVHQFVFTNIGNGSGWSQPIHLHGHSFYVMKIVFGKYDKETGKYIADGGQDNIDIVCNDTSRFCSDAKWRNASWAHGRHPGLNWEQPPQKDTIIVPSGGYVVIRFIADNPGVWYLHSQVDLYDTNGMGMIINELPKKQLPVPEDFPVCGAYYLAPQKQCEEFTELAQGLTGLASVVSLILLVQILYCGIVKCLQKFRQRGYVAAS